MNSLQSILHSALWAAYGDALGFISELIDAPTLYNRVGSNKISKLVPWNKRVGGPYGPEVSLPLGCYSDDTQLRLATCRSIDAKNNFDVELFAKIELTVWPSYALGGGRGTKSAALNLTKKDTNWFSNFFISKKSNYLDCGGNGAAMRIQPHIWSCPNRTHPKNFIIDVIRNSICTHGHFRGILGAVFHSLCLSAAIQNQSIPGFEIWKQAVHHFGYVLDIMSQDSNIKLFWIPTWEKLTGRQVFTEINNILQECLDDIHIIESINTKNPEEAYANAVNKIGATKKASLGSGTKTAILASYLAWLFKGHPPKTALILASNSLGSDTDTIATMAGAIMGACSPLPPEELPADATYIASEAKRLHSISNGIYAQGFSYPKLQEWTPPKTQLDAVGTHNNKILLSGLGHLDNISDSTTYDYNTNFFWQWYSLPFGQNVLLKRRSNLNPLPSGNCPENKNSLSTEHPYVQNSLKIQKSKLPIAPLLDYNFDQPKTKNSSESSSLASQIVFNSNAKNSIADANYLDINLLTQEAIASNFNETLIGKHITEIARQPNGIECAIGYAAIIAKAIASRIKKQKN